MIEKRYAILVAVTIILVFFVGFFYFYNFNLKNPINFNGNAPSGGNNPPQVPSSPKVFGFASASCTVSNNADVLKFKIQTGATGFGQGELSAYLDNILADFKDSNGNSISSIALAADSISNEFSFTASDHQNSRKITVAIPTGSFDKILTCS